MTGDRPTVVLGAGGLLGRHLVQELGTKTPSLRGFDRAAVDITNEKQIADALEGAHYVVNAAAYTDVDGCEQNDARAFAVNALGAENVARVADRIKAVVLHVSTDFVFDGDLDRPYDEFDTPNPRSMYARSKRAGEILVEKAARRSHIVRVQGLYGAGGRNFISKLRELLLARKTGMRIDRERQVQPTWARSAARAVADILFAHHFGTWHVSCRGRTTWHDFTARMAARLGLPVNWETASFAELNLPAARPKNCRFDHRRLAMCGPPLLPTWEEAQDDFLREEAAK